MTSNCYYTRLIKNSRAQRRKYLESMCKDGYEFGDVTYFDSLKGIGTIISKSGEKYMAHYKNMTRMSYKTLDVGHEVHFKPGIYNGSVVATEITIVYS